MNQCEKKNKILVPFIFFPNNKTVCSLNRKMTYFPIIENAMYSLILRHSLRGGLGRLYRAEESGCTLCTAGSYLFVVLARVRMKRERFDAGSVWNFLV